MKGMCRWMGRVVLLSALSGLGVLADSGVVLGQASPSGTEQSAAEARGLQVNADQAAALSPVHRNLIAANPFLLLAEWLNVEYERVVRSDLGLGAQVEFLNLNDGYDDYTVIGGLLRYYPQERAPRGFFGGVHLSYVGIEETSYDYDCFAPCEPLNREGRYPALGLEIGYNWLLGSTENFYLSAGGGLHRVLGSDMGEEFLPIIRVAAVGWAF
jgi:hypothetical protein